MTQELVGAARSALAGFAAASGGGCRQIPSELWVNFQVKPGCLGMVRYGLIWFIPPPINMVMTGKRIGMISDKVDISTSRIHHLG